MLCSAVSEVTSAITFERVPDQFRNFKHGVQAVQVRLPPGFQLILQMADYRLSGCQIAGRLDHNQPFAGHAERMQFAENGNMVYPGIGSGVADEHHAVL